MLVLTPKAPEGVDEVKGTMHPANCDPVCTDAVGHAPVAPVGASCVANAVFVPEMIG